MERRIGRREGNIRKSGVREELVRNKGGRREREEKRGWVRGAGEKEKINEERRKRGYEKMRKKKDREIEIER